MSKRLWVLGSADPEMERIEELLRTVGEDYVHATRNGERVRGGDAYRCDPVEGATHWVECESPGQEREAVIDHHRPGDPGYGRPPDDFLSASSIGQVISELARLGALPESWERLSGVPGAFPAGAFIDRVWGSASPRWLIGAGTWIVVPHALILCAAADHCLAHAYRGLCPWVAPDELMHWRAESRAAHQGRYAMEVLADIERARAKLRTAPLAVVWAECPDCGEAAQAKYATEGIDWDGSCSIGGCYEGGNSSPGRVVAAEYKDMRGRHVPELPEASAREGLCFIADGLPDPDGRVKVVCQSGTAAQIRAFLEVWAPAQGLVDVYGDPERGIAGGYVQP